jgi:tRNA A-37 threonylcarbamoyl transferase component Bud32/tetratricopeptide (TPR) repeat protein
LPPQRIGKYEVTGKLGQGAMGEVFRAHDPVLKRDVAVKRITAGLDADETIRRRFQREAESAAKLAHPNIITVYELGLEGGQLFMAMELLDGVDLKQALAARRMSVDEKVGLVTQICEGLAFAHSHGIVHRDLKPANIHVLPSGKVKIMDFGLARLPGSEMTSTGMVMGTPHYMSPEQVRGQKADARSDVFAVGCVLYELLAGHKPFDAESMHGVLYKILQEEPVPVREAAPGTPEAVARVVERALAKGPDQRFTDAGEMLAALRAARGAATPGRERPLERGPSAPAAREAPRRPAAEGARTSSRPGSHPGPHARSSRVLLVGSAVALLAVAFGAWALRGRWLDRPAAAPPPAAPSSGLARKAVESQVELARRRLEAGSFRDAHREAEVALRLDPGNAGAQQVLQEAGAALRAIDEAAAAVREAAAAGDRERLADAAFALVKLDPAHEEGEEAARAAGPAIRPRADEARRLERQARDAARNAGAEATAAFEEGSLLERRAEQALQAGQPAAALRLFLEARRAFERAGRARP